MEATSGVRLLTVATTWNSNVQNFDGSARAHGWVPEYLGVGTPWKGFRTKMQQFHDACAVIPPGTLVVCTDSNDVIVVGSPAAFLEEWTSHFGSMELVFGAETWCTPMNCRPVPALWARQFGVDAWPPRRFLNSGLIAGSARALTEMFAWQLDTKMFDDQLGAVAYVNSISGAACAVDDAQRLFVNDNYGRTQDYAGTRAIGDDGAPLTACFIHFPGMSLGLHRLLDIPTSYAATGRATLGAQYLAPVPSPPTFLLLGVVVLFTLIGAMSVVRAMHGVHSVVACVVPAVGATLLLLPLSRRAATYSG